MMRLILTVLVLVGLAAPVLAQVVYQPMAPAPPVPITCQPVGNVIICQ